MGRRILLVLAALISLSLLLSLVTARNGHGGHHFDGGKYGPGSVKSGDCPGRCASRCSQTQHHKPCMFFCQKCCAKCLCVPPGTYGNKQLCPCYNSWKTKEGGPKCP